MHGFCDALLLVSLTQFKSSHWLKCSISGDFPQKILFGGRRRFSVPGKLIHIVI